VPLVRKVRAVTELAFAPIALPVTHQAIGERITSVTKGTVMPVVRAAADFARLLGYSRI
jgi:hypothetical protein